METNSIKDKAFLVLISSVAFFSVKFLFTYFSKSKKIAVDDDSESEYSSNNSSLASFVDGLHETEVEAFGNSVSSDSCTDPNLVYTHKNNLVFGMNDEIVGKDHLLDTSISSLSSYALQAKKVTSKLMKDSRETNAKKFLDRLEKIKSKVIQKRTTLTDYHDQFRDCNGFVRIDKDLSSELEKSTFKSTADSWNKSFDSILKNDKQETKDTEEKITKENKRQNDLAKLSKINNKETIQKEKKLRKKWKTSRKDGFNIDYEDVNRKDNFIFFEMLAIYAGSYLDNSQQDISNLEKKVSKRRLRKDRKCI